MDRLSREDQVQSDDLIKTLERNAEILRIEAHHGKRIDNELETRLELYNEVSHGLASKLDSLWNLAGGNSPIGAEIKSFADRVANSWTCLNKQIYEKYSKIRMASRTLHGIPLSLLLDKIKKETVLLKVSLQVHERSYSKEYAVKGYKLIGSIEAFLISLERCDCKLQQYLAVSKITPQLVKLESTVERYAVNVQLISGRNVEQSDLDVFPLVVQLLTGELLAEEPENPYHVLAENLPRKPVFIIKNFKRKGDA